MIRLSLVFAVALLTIQLRVAWAESGGADGAAARLSCFQAPDYCLRNFAQTRDRDYYELCMLSERICRDYRFNWKLIRLRVRDNAILNDCFPVVSAGDLLKLCRSDQSRDKASCRQNIMDLTSGADLRGTSRRPATGSGRPVACSKTGSFSAARYIKAFVGWAGKHPSQQHLPAQEGLIAATAAVRPCPNLKVRRGRLR